MNNVVIFRGIYLKKIESCIKFGEFTYTYPTIFPHFQKKQRNAPIEKVTHFDAF